MATRLVDSKIDWETMDNSARQVSQLAELDPLNYYVPALQEMLIGIEHLSLYDIASSLTILVHRFPVSLNATTLYDMGLPEMSEDLYFNDPLEPVPLMTRPIKLLLTHVGDGDSILQSGAEEIGPFDD